jgi:pseudaminic acid biosynthesis-associated methylase
MQDEQTKFWQGQFGNDYTARNINLVENNYQMFSKIFIKMFSDDGVLWNDDIPEIKSIIEFGSGSGQNIQALQRIFPDVEYTAVEINKIACDELQGLNKINLKIYDKSILDWNYNYKYDLVLSKGLLIHIHPDNIQKAYEVLYNASNKYILLCEYYSPERQKIFYRGEHNKLWKFDFIKPMLDKDCKILDYGFVSKYDKYFEDDLTWVLFEK